MKKEKRITHPVYADYPEQPYISPERDLVMWEKYPEKFHYSKVEKKQMIRTKEGLLPGDVVMLWRIGFDNFTTETVIPAYFEYRYGVNSEESIQLLTEKGYIEKMNARDSIDLVTVPVLKRILKDQGLSVSGKKQDLVERALNEVDNAVLEKEIEFKRYRATDKGRKVLEKHDALILAHGPKSM